jgi:hypothetical protein
MVRVPVGINLYVKNGVDNGFTPFFLFSSREWAIETNRIVPIVSPQFWGSSSESTGKGEGTGHKAGDSGGIGSESGDKSRAEPQRPLRPRFQN